jgi:hypothetical protein
MKLIKLVKKSLKISVLSSWGKGPEKRYGHSMEYYKKINKIIIYGGKNDEWDKIFEDIYLFDLSN